MGRNNGGAGETVGMIFFRSSYTKPSNQVRQVLKLEPISTEKKMELIRSIREEHAKNIGSLKQREHILFGGQGPFSPSDSTALTKAPAAAGNTSASFRGFKIRLFLAVLLFIAFMLMDISNLSIKGVNSSLLQTAIQKNFSTNPFDFIADIPYTLTEEMTSRK